jgi:hypothetical protein
MAKSERKRAPQTSEQDEAVSHHYEGSERKASTEFVRKREQTPKGKKRERRSEQTPEPAAEDARSTISYERLPRPSVVATGIIRQFPLTL